MNICLFACGMGIKYTTSFFEGDIYGERKERKEGRQAKGQK